MNNYSFDDPLVERVVMQIKQDISDNKLEYLEYLLGRLDKNALINFLPEDERSKFIE